MKLTLPRLPVLNVAALLRQAGWVGLFGVIIFYNFHRYILGYSSGGFEKEGYQQTPFHWQVGKYVLVALCLGLIYSQSRFRARLPAWLLAVYAYLALVLVINGLSAGFYRSLFTDELEYVVYAGLLLPMAFMLPDDLLDVKRYVPPFLEMAQWALAGSNLLVIYNFFVNDRLPFHAYRGALLRFGSFWDDPNAFAIFSVLLLAYAGAHRRWGWVALHLAGIALSVSFTSYACLLTLAGYWAWTAPRRWWWLAGLAVVGLVGLGVLWYNFELVAPILEAKQGSIDLHTNAPFHFALLPLARPLQMHETWWFSILINYFPFSMGPIAASLWGVWAVLTQPRSWQGLYFLLFAVGSLFLPIAYMFPLNFLGLLFLTLWAKGVRF